MLEASRAPEGSVQLAADTVPDMPESDQELEQKRMQTAIRLANIKLEIGDRRSKRRLKERERSVLLQKLAPMITTIKLPKFFEEQIEICKEKARETNSNEYMKASPSMFGKPMEYGKLEVDECNNNNRRELGTAR